MCNLYLPILWATMITAVAGIGAAIAVVAATRRELRELQNELEACLDTRRPTDGFPGSAHPIQDGGQ